MVYLIRHGETDDNLNNIYQGVGQDNSLNETGRRQAGLLGKWLKKYYPLPSVIFSSPAARALETARIVKNELVGMKRNPEIMFMPKLREINHGEWEGKSDAELKTLYPKLYRLWRNHPMEVIFPGGESMEHSKVRILNTWDEILKRRFKIILIVAHGGVNFQVLNSVLESQKLRNVRQDNACLNVIERSPGGRMRVALLNFAPHLFQEAPQ